MAIDVMIVDDDRVNRRLLKRYIENLGYSARLAESGEEALELYEEKRPDVVLLDVMMGGIDGFETARRMKSALTDQYIPILMLSALNSPESIATGLGAGADDFLSKPYSSEVLHSRILAALRTRGLFNTLAEKKRELQQLHDRSLKEQQIAARVMASLIRSDLLAAPFFRYRSVPAEIFNGDLVMAEPTIEGNVRVLLADFSGHGLAAAIGSQPVASIFRTMTHKGHQVPMVLQVANQQLKSFLPPELFLAACVVEIDPLGGTVVGWNAGMPPVFVVSAGGGVKAKISSSHLPLGIADGLSFERRSPIELDRGDRVYLHSDGLTEAMNVQGEEFGDGRLVEVLETLRAADVWNRLWAEHGRFIEDRAMSDDLTLIEIAMDERMRSVVPRAIAPNSGLRVSVELGPEMLARNEPTHLMKNIAEQLPPLVAKPDALLVLLELFNNAVDHGLLGLSSSIKDEPGGFERYYELRDAALSNLESGRVRCDFEQRGGDSGELIVRVEDSGPGFDVERCLRRSEQDSVDTHGRGIVLAERLCQELRYWGSGNRVEAVFDLSSSAGEAGVKNASERPPH